MLLRTQSLRSIRPSIEEQCSTSSPLLQNDGPGPEESVEVHDGNRSSTGLLNESSSIEDHPEVIELDDIGDIAHVERSSSETEPIGSSM